ncbi:hypothetical protein PMAC_000374 [Pneumocystis sp. 'macacae']|nr:hypothetical protein PMAC_000374 [Pneumocystis sp. 'macacae']
MGQESEDLSCHSVKEFLSIKKFPNVPEIPSIKHRQSEFLSNFQFSEENILQFLSKRPFSSYQIPKKKQTNINYLNTDIEGNKKDKEQTLFFASISKNIENYFLIDQNEISQNQQSEKKKLTNKIIEINEKESILDSADEKKNNLTKTKYSETYDTITLINYIQKEFLIWLKNMEKNKRIIPILESQHDIARFKYRQTHDSRKIIRLLSLVRLQISSL